MNRNAKANAKRAAQQARRDERGSGVSPLDEVFHPLDGPVPQPEDPPTE